MSLEISRDAVGLRLARIDGGERLILCEAMRFEEGWAAVHTVLRRASIAGRVEVNGVIQNHFADTLDDQGDLVETIALDAKSYSAIKNRWMRCKVERQLHT